MSTHPLAGEAAVHCAACGEAVPTALAVSTEVSAASLPAASCCPACQGDWRLDGRFTLLTLVGKGAVGLTWRARTLVDLPGDRGTLLAAGSVVAVKEMAFRLTDAEAVRRLIAREARVLRELNHPAVPRWYADFIAGQGRQRAFYLVQAFIEGEDLHAESAHRRYRLAEVLDLVDEVAGILEYLHDLSPPVVHRDLKPRNIQRERGSNRLFLLDFGAVKDVVDDPSTGGSTVAGTFGYMAPEQFAGDACPASDVYALGVVMVGLLARKAPDQMLRGHTLDWRPHVSVPPVALDLLADMLDPEVRKRIPDGGVLRRRIAETRAALAGGVAEAQRPAATPASEPVTSLAKGIDLLKRLAEDAQAHALARSDAGVAAKSRRGRGRVVSGQVEPRSVDGHPLLLLPVTLTEAQRPRRKNITLLLAFVGGWLGGPWWYLGHPVMGVLSVMFCWSMVPWLLSMVKAIRVRALSDAEFDARYNAEALDTQRRLRAAEEVNRITMAASQGDLSERELNRQLGPLLAFLERGSR